MTDLNTCSPKYSIVIPVYRSKETLDELYESLTRVMDSLGEEYEIVLVNDGSPDDSWNKLKALREKDKRLSIVNLMRNYGQHNALMCGFAQSNGRYVITMDDDLQHPPEEIPKLIDSIENSDTDVVVGRYGEKKHNLFRNFGTWFMKQLYWHTMQIPKNLDMTSFRIIKKEIVDAALRFKVPAPRVDLIMFSITTNMSNVEISHAPRKAGKSGYTLRKLISNTLDNVLNYSSLPLRVVSYFGMIVSAFSVALSIYYLTLFLVGGTSVSGFTTLVLLTVFFGGAILMTLGIVGEYLTRIIRSCEQKPSYVIREHRGSKHAP